MGLALTGVALYVVVVLLAFACAAVALLSFLTYREHDERQGTEVVQERYGDVMDAASDEALALVNIDYRDLDTTYDTVRAGATGQFLKEYTESWDEQVDLFKQNKSVSTGEIRAAAVSSIDDDSATVMVVVEGTAQNTATGNKPQQRRYRWRLDVVDVDGAWLVNKLEFVG
ncbi:MAG: hypothetical protein WC642_11885 [Nocardioides sp.]|jgi:Mce-associated membrane protein